MTPWTAARWALNPVTNVPIRDTQREKSRRPCEDGANDTDETEAHTEHSGALRKVILKFLPEVGFKKKHRKEQTEQCLGLRGSSCSRQPDGKSAIPRAWSRILKKRTVSAGEAS